jgi:hypothetical protein
VNRAAKQHLARATEFLAKGEGFYHKAAKEIAAAKEADPKLTNREIGERFDKSERWIWTLLKWHEDPVSDTGSPFVENKGRAEYKATAATKKVLRDAPLEQVEKIISELPKERAAAIGAAAGDAYMRIRHQHDEGRARRTPAQIKEQEAARGETRRQTAEMMSGFTIFGIVNYLGLATETLQGMVEEHTVTKRGLREVEKALREFVAEYRVAAAMAGLDAELEALQ